MRKTESNKLNMYDGVVSYMDTNSDAYSDLPVITESFNEFKNVVEQIKSKDLDFKNQTKGVTAEKLNAEEALISYVLKIANALYVLGVKTKNSSLQINAKVTKSSLVQARDNILANKASQILSLAAEHEADLANYGITAEMISAAHEKLNEFNEALGRQVNEHANAVAAREELTQLFEKADAILKEELDPMIEMFSDSNPNFYNGYAAARVIRDLGIGHSTPQTETSGEG